MTPPPQTIEEKKLVRKTNDTVIYEGGWWMTREDYEYVNGKDYCGNGIFRDRNLVLSRDEQTHQITYAFLPK